MDRRTRIIDRIVRTADASWSAVEDAYDEGVLEERERCASKLRHSNASLLLMAGEMTAQELRTVHAVLNAIRSQIELAESADTTTAQS
jgi:hypothetical protein